MSYSKRIDTKSIYNENIVCVLGAPAYNLDAMKRCLVRQHFYRHGLVFYVRSDNYLEKLPLWTAKLFPLDNWYEKDVYNTTSDGGNAYTKDPEFLKFCLIYTCLSNQNKCLSFDGSDGRRYQNELCFDNSRIYSAGLDDKGNQQPVPASAVDELPLALKDLNKYIMNKSTALNDDETALLGLWNDIITEARKTANYNPEFNYGVYQITKELDTYREEGTGRRKNMTIQLSMVILKLCEYC